jgi:hypothetical protein
MISIAWKFRANYAGSISMFHLPLLALVPVFVLFSVRLSQGLITSFYSVLSMSGNFMSVLGISIALNLLFMAGSIIFISTNRV